MSKLTAVVIACLSIVVIILALGLVRARRTGKRLNFGTPYQAVLLDNGQVYYGKLSGIGTRYPEMTDVYYIVRTEDPQTKQVKNVLVKRGNELHAPTKTFLDARHIIMIEPVGPDSQVARLIQESKSQPAGQPAPQMEQTPQPAAQAPPVKKAHHK